MILTKKFMLSKTHQKIFYNIIFLFSLFYSSLTFSQNTQKLYLNILDLDNIFEPKLKFASTNKSDDKSPIIINLNFENDSVSCYELKRSYKPNKHNQLVDMNGDESYELMVFKKEHADINNTNIELSSNNIYETWFSSYHQVILRNGDTEITGMWPFLNTNNLQLNKLSIHEQISDEDIDLSAKSSEAAMNQLFEMAAGVARQVAIQDSIKHKNILKTLKSSDEQNTLIDIPDDSFLNYFLAKKYTMDITQILKIMYSIASSVEYLHDSNIAHGDVKLSSLFIKNSDIVLSNFERFSIFKKTDDLLGVKKFTFYNNNYQPPELRYPVDTARKWDYTNATFEGDIWSLGMLFAAMLYIYYPNHPNLESLKVASELPQYVMKAQFISWMFKCSPYIKLMSSNVLKFSLNSYITITNAYNYITKEPLQINKKSEEVFNQLFIMINSCNDPNPENRLTATQIKNKISELMSKYEN